VTGDVGENRTVPSRHPMLTYTALRLALFVVPFGVLLALGTDLLWAMLVAAFFSGIVSVFLLSRQRDAVSVAIASRTERARQRMAERTAAEDAWDDAQRGASAEREPKPEE
jgi:Protein of unknown function (DUF4229)